MRAAARPQASYSKVVARPDGSVIRRTRPAGVYSIVRRAAERVLDRRAPAHAVVGRARACVPSGRGSAQAAPEHVEVEARRRQPVVQRA